MAPKKLIEQLRKFFTSYREKNQRHEGALTLTDETILDKYANGDISDSGSETSSSDDDSGSDSSKSKKDPTKFNKGWWKFLAWICQCYDCNELANKCLSHLGPSYEYGNLAIELTNGPDQILYTPYRWITVFKGDYWGIDTLFVPLIAGSFFFSFIYVIAKVHRIETERNRTSLSHLARKIPNPSGDYENDTIQKGLLQAIIQQAHLTFYNDSTNKTPIDVKVDDNYDQFLLLIPIQDSASILPKLNLLEKFISVTSQSDNLDWVMGAFSNYSMYYWITWFSVCLYMGSTLAFPFWWIFLVAFAAQIIMPILMRLVFIPLLKLAAKIFHHIKLSKPPIAAATITPATSGTKTTPSLSVSNLATINNSAEFTRLANTIIAGSNDVREATKIAITRELVQRQTEDLLFQLAKAYRQTLPKENIPTSITFTFNSDNTDLSTTTAPQTSDKPSKSAIENMLGDIEEESVTVFGRRCNNLVAIARISGLMKGFISAMFALWPISDGVLCIIALAKNLSLATCANSATFVLASTSMTVISFGIAIVAAIYFAFKNSAEMKAKTAKYKTLASDLNKVKSECIALQNSIRKLKDLIESKRKFDKTNPILAVDPSDSFIDFDNEDSISAFLREFDKKKKTDLKTYLSRFFDCFRVFLCCLGTGVLFIRFIFQSGNIASVIAFGFTKEALASLAIPLITIGTLHIPGIVVFLVIAAIVGFIWAWFKVYEFRAQRNMEHNEATLKGLLNVADALHNEEVVYKTQLALFEANDATTIAHPKKSVLIEKTSKNTPTPPQETTTSSSTSTDNKSSSKDATPCIFSFFSTDSYKEAQVPKQEEQISNQEPAKIFNDYNNITINFTNLPSGTNTHS
jgi:hypothetical protein